ncbi:MAG TPA: pitrilysin family protein [Clostridia bacterium]|nr:pitrilysin family protein [Clostridia bacterium]
MYQVSQVDNGLTVATATMPQMRSVSVGLWIGVGSRYEAEVLNGACHFIEHMLFKGTRRRTAREISQAVEGVGGYLNAFTSEELTCFHARAGHDRLEELLDVLADMLLHSRFAPEDIGKEREVIKEEMAMYLDEPQHQVQELLNTTLWPDQPLGRPITGSNRTLDGMNRSGLLRFLQSHYVSGSAVLVAAGNVRHGSFLRAVKRYARHLPKGSRLQCSPSRNEQHAPRVRLLHRKIKQTQIALGIRTCSRHDPRRYTLRLLNTLLGENMSSRLFQVIREDRGLAYSIYSTPSFFADTGDLVVSAGLDTKHIEKTLRLVLREMRRMRETLPGRRELRQARDYVIGQIELAQESTEAQMNWVGEQLLGYGRIYKPEILKRRLSQVTGAEIRLIARDFFRPERMNLALVSPLKSATHLERLLAG